MYSYLPLQEKWGSVTVTFDTYGIVQVYLSLVLLLLQKAANWSTIFSLENHVWLYEFEIVLAHDDDIPNKVDNWKEQRILVLYPYVTIKPLVTVNPTIV